MKISVLTATYNREKLLPKLFESLKKNYETFQDFEWIIMDDGSNDNTKKEVKKWIKEVNFKIDYHYQENEGKQKEINDAMQYVTGDAIIEVDSDDYLLDNALKTIAEDFIALDNDEVYGIIYKRKLGKKNTDTKKELNNKVVTLFDIHNKYGYDFDMAIVFKTEVRKKYYYEVCKNEKFVTEARLYYKLDQFYKGMVFKDKYLVYGEYVEEGYSKNINKIFKKYPYGYYEYFNECLTYIKKDTLFKRKLYFIKHYILFSYLCGLSKRECIKRAKRYNFIIALLVIPGYIKASRF